MPTGLWLMRGLRLAGLLSATAARVSSSTTTTSTASSCSQRATSMASSGRAVISRAKLVRHRPGFVPSSWPGVSTATTSRTQTSTYGDSVRKPSSAPSARTLAQRRHSTSALAHGGGAIRSHTVVTALERRAAGTSGVRSSRQSLRAAGTGSFSSGCSNVAKVTPAPAVSAVRRPGGELSAAATVTGAVAEDGGVAGLEEGSAADDGESPFKVNLLEMSNEEVEVFMKSIGEPKYRAGQVVKWMYEGGALSFDDMTNLPKALRAKLGKVATVGSLEVAAQQTSKDGTRKRAYRLADGQLIESVLMPYADGRRTACISSQVGCAMGCVFCATGQMGFKRQLTSSEIFEQAYRFSQELAAKGERLSNVVFMGMGEPLANYNTVMEAVRRINTELGVGARHITISTVGLAPRILRLAQENIQVKLAVSLHAANDQERSALLPMNRRFPLATLMDACKEYVDASGRRMTFEWALIQGENDSAEVAAELGRLLRPLKGMCHVNIIPLNPTAGYDGGPSMAEAVEDFVAVLERYGVPATPRMRRGIDIDAGCGQLTTKMTRDDVLGKGL